VAVAPVLIDLGVLLALVTLIGLRFGYTYSLGKVLLAAASMFASIAIHTPFGTWHPLGFAADALRSLDHTVQHALGRGIADMQAAWNAAASYTAHAFGWIGREIASISHDTAQAIEGLHVTQITNVYRRVAPRVDYRVGALAAAVAALTARVTGLDERVASWAKHKVIVVEHAIAVPNVGAIPRTIPRVGGLERELDAVAGKVRSLGKRLAPAALAGLVVAAIGRLGFGWVRCSKVGRAGRTLCGMNQDLLESLLFDTLLIVGSISVVEFAKELQAVEGAAVSGLRGFVREI
jgi:hypothetical protein